MNKIFKVIYNKARHSYVVVSELAHSHSKPRSVAGLGKKSLSAMVLSALILTGSSFSALAAENVTYDTGNEQVISLNNKDGNGTKITNVAKGDIAAASKDAVNGSQLFETNSQISDLVDALNKSNAAIGQAQTDVTRMKTQNITFRSDISTLKTQVSAGWNATIDGANVKTINPADNSLNFTAGDDVSITDPGNGSIKIGVTPTGKVASGNSHVVSGDAVYTAVKAEETAREAADTAINNKIGNSTDGTYIKGADSIGTNLSTLDTQVKTNADAIAKETKDRTDAITTITNNIGSLSDSAVQYDKDSNKAKVTLKGTSGTTITNLADASLSDSSTDAVTGRQLYTEQQARIDAISSLNTSIGTLRGNAVLYDTDVKDIITLGGSKGTKITNLQDAVLSSASTDAVTGRQLWTTNENMSGFSKQINKNAESLKGLSTSVSNSLDSVAAMSESISVMDTTKADTSLTNLSEAGRIVINEAATKAVQTYMKNLKNESGTTSDSSKPKTKLKLARQAMPLAAPPAPLATGTPENVTYDASNDQMISLNNTDGNGTKIANVAKGELAAASKDAVNGSQLYETNTKISDLLDALNKSNTAIGQAQTDITRMKTQNITFKSDINTLKTQVSTGWNVTIDGASVKNINPGDNNLNFTAGDDVSITDPGNGNIKIGVKATGKVEAGNKHIVTGDDVFQAIKDMPTTGTLSVKANTALDNLNDAGKKVISDLAQKAIQPKLDEKADKNLANLDEAGKKVITDLAQGATKVVSGKNTIVTEKTENGVKTYTVDVNDTAIEKSIQPKLDEKANKDLDNLSDKGKAAIKDAVKDDLDKKANVDASNLTKDSIAKWQKALGNGEINGTSTGLVTGKAVYDAIKDLPTTGGGEGLVKYDKDSKAITVAAEKDATTVDFSGKDADGNTITRTVTGITTDANDTTSAANVGYVQDVAGNLANGVNRIANQLRHDINRVGAGAAALSSLHPGEFDPDNKLEFSAGYGHYKGANAAALGAYYHPNEDTIISLASTMGNGDPMLSAGVTFKLGPTGKNTLSRTALTKQVAQDQEVIKALAGKLANMEARMNQVLNLLDMSKQKSFNDVPDSHWAKMAVDTLHGNGSLKGYPDGNFHGDKAMTRYEYAQMLYEALKKGAHIDQNTLDEYGPELTQIQLKQK